ncbi:MAG: AraC family transcriptional regulator [Lentisphaeria bacterium]|nr:AraC family transcriptional regulator [Lentisphaeria bacterium]
MDVFHKSYFFTEKKNRVPGCAFYLQHAGYLHPAQDTVYCFGSYNCWHVVAWGEGFVKCNSQTFYLKKGDLFSVMYESQIEYGPLPGTEWEFYYLRVEGPQCDALTRRMGLTPDHPVRYGGGEKLIRLFREVWALAAQDCRIPELYNSGLLKITACMVSEKTSRADNFAELVEKAEKLLNSPMNFSYNINELSEALHVSRITLFHAFKQQKNCSPSEYILKLRMEKCLQLLKENPHLLLSEISTLAHFRDEKYFIRFFRQHMKMTPGQYRRQLLKKSFPEK